MGMIHALFDFFLHIDVHLGQIIQTYGAVSYGIMFLIIFVETGLVFVPFLPGDSLLFAAGAFAALGTLNVWLLLFVITLAAILGDTANYWIGHFFGDALLRSSRVPLNQEHIDETQRFFAKYGSKTIVLARFVPIVRSFAPFVAGIGHMKYSKFITYNVIGGIAWVTVGILAGFLFGNIPFVKANFSLVVLGVVAVSMIPLLIPLFQKLMQHDKR